MKILKRNSNIYNIMAFQIFSLVFLHVLFSLVDGYSSLKLSTLFKIASNNLSLILLSLINLVLIFLVKKASRYLLVLTSVTTSIICFLLFLESFNKSILIYNILYIVIAFFFCMIWKLELNEASYNSFFDSRVLRPLGLRNTTVSINQKGSDIKLSGTITNWSEETCFIVLNDSKKLRDTVEIEVNYMGVDFSFESVVVTRSSDGVGLRITNEKKGSILNWLDFYDIISDRGIHPVKI